MLRLYYGDKMNRGFTLVEIIAVIVLLSLIMIVAMPAYNSVAKNVKTKSYESKKVAIEKAMQKFANEYLIDTIKPADNGAGTYCQQYDLEKYIVANGIYAGEDDDKIINPLTNIKFENACVKVKYTLSDYRLASEFVDSCQSCDEAKASCSCK